MSETLITAHGIRLQRIISFGQVSPQGFWYDQKEAEWVMLLKGRARLVIAGEAESSSWGQEMRCTCRRIAATASNGLIPIIRRYGWRCS